MRGFLKDKKDVVILLLSILFLIKIPQTDKKFIFWVISGVLICGALDFLIQGLMLKPKVFPKSAIITGFIVLGILDYQQPWFALIIFSVVAVLSKHFIRFRNKHILNPANFGLFAAALFKLPLTWNIESNIPLIIITGIYLAYSFKKLTHVLGFLIFFSGLFGLARINPFGLISWFFVFIMLIEPKTSGYGALRGFVFGSIAGIASFLVFKFFTGFDFFVAPLFIANLFNPLLEKIKERRANV